MTRAYVVVDVETTGTRPGWDRVIEVAAVRLERGRIVDRWRSFCRPDRRVPAFITRITGIGDDDVTDAPAFDEIAGDLLRRLKDAVFVAHNARFDAGFLRAEFARAGRAWTPRVLCTVRLARALVPGLAGYSLDRVTSHFNVVIENRHRALGDAEATAEVLRLLLRRRAARRVVEAELHDPAPPVDLPPGAAELPRSRGVWTLRDPNGRPLRSGRSAVLFDDFPPAFAALPKKLRIRAARVEFEAVESDLEAQAALGQEEQREYPFLTVTPRGDFVVGRPVAGRIFGPFRTVRDIRMRLSQAQGLPLEEAIRAITSGLAPVGLLRERTAPSGPGLLVKEEGRLLWVREGRLQKAWSLEIDESEIREEIRRLLAEPFDPAAWPRVGPPRGDIKNIEYFLHHA